MRIVMSAFAALVLFTAPNWSQCGQASLSPRNGGGSNPSNLNAFNPPVLGTTFRLELDCTVAVPPLNGLAFLQGRVSTTAGVMTRGGELLLDLSSPRISRQIEVGDNGLVLTPTWSIPPNDPSLCGLPISFQGLCAGGGMLQLSNAIDVRVGL